MFTFKFPPFPPLFCFGLFLGVDDVSQFNKPAPISASQKDVPGSTIGTVSLLAAAGVKGFHAGVNDFSTVPAVPITPEMYEPCRAFRWRDNESAPVGPGGESAELLGYWCSGYSQGYGPHTGIVPEMVVRVPNSTHTLVFLMCTDNSGPQSVDEITRGWANLHVFFPNAKVDASASAFDSFTKEAWEKRAGLPVITQELGDTWIRGTASDPTKARRYRTVARELASAIESGAAKVSDPRVAESLTWLVKLPEHTYGSNDARVTSIWDNDFFDAHVNDSDYEITREGYIDQRAYVVKSVAALGTHPLRAKIEAALQASVSISVSTFQNVLCLPNTCCDGEARAPSSSFKHKTYIHSPSVQHSHTHARIQRSRCQFKTCLDYCLGINMRRRLLWLVD